MTGTEPEDGRFYVPLPDRRLIPGGSIMRNVFYIIGVVVVVIIILRLAGIA